MKDFWPDPVLVPARPVGFPRFPTRSATRQAVESLPQTLSSFEARVFQKSERPTCLEGLARTRFSNENQQITPGSLETPADAGAKAIESPNELPLRLMLNSYAYRCISMHGVPGRVNHFYYAVVIIFAVHETPSAQRDPGIGSLGGNYQPRRPDA